MNKQEYEQKKRECWEEFQVANRTTLETTKQAFEYIFDRAFALGKQTETITQEEIENEAVDYAFGENKKRPDARPDTAPEYACEDLIDAFKAGANYALGKQEKDADTVIQGWVARDKGGFISLFSYCPDRVIYDDLGFWGHNDGSDEIDLPKDSFPDLTWDDDPEPVEIIIKRKKK